MPDTLNKQTLINLLIDSPLREPIKINLIDIINNTSEPDLPKVYPTIVKELEIFQKATERRMKLADETIAKLGGTSEEPAIDSMPPTSSAPVQSSDPTTPSTPTSIPPLDLPPLPTPSTPTSPAEQPVAPVAPTPTVTPEPTPTLSTEPLSVPPLDLPPLPQMPNTPATPDMSLPTPPASTPAESPATPLPSPEPLGGPAQSSSSDEAALAEIQKELESLKAGVAADANPAPTATTTT